MALGGDQTTNTNHTGSQSTDSISEVVLIYICLLYTSDAADEL